MDTYWNLKPKERAALTSAQVEKYLDIELMERGVEKVSPPVYGEQVEFSIPKTTYYEVYYYGEYSETGSKIVFATIEQAQAFINLLPSVCDYNYDAGEKFKFARNMRDCSIKMVELCKQDDIASYRSIIQKNKAVEKSNAAMAADYKTACKAADEATAVVWEDWRECQKSATFHQKVCTTFEEYYKLCKEDGEIALGFLKKLYNDEQIDAATVWFELPSMVASVVHRELKT